MLSLHSKLSSTQRCQYAAIRFSWILDKILDDAGKLEFKNVENNQHERACITGRFGILLETFGLWRPLVGDGLSSEPYVSPVTPTRTTRHIILIHVRLHCTFMCVFYIFEIRTFLCNICFILLRSKYRSISSKSVSSKAHSLVSFSNK